ncbi:glycosyltransferase [bacterium]|nr:glycosyltransferase [bacterium]
MIVGQENQQQFIKVSVIIPAYNFEKYIAQSIEGVLMQETDFPIEILIHDDASTDSTAAIIRSYQEEHPDLIHTILRTENLYSKGIWGAKKLYKQAQGYFIAICEGDDFWTDPYKLQKQVDFMEAHPNCSISCHKVLYHFEDGGSEDYEFPGISGNKVFQREEILGKYISATCSTMIVNRKINELEDFSRDFLVGDLPLIYFYLNLGDMGYLDERMATYRLHSQSFYHPLNSIQQEMIQFDTFVKIKTRLRIRRSNNLDRKIINHGLHLLEAYQKELNYRGMRRILRQSLQAQPSIGRSQLPYYIKYAIIAFIPWIDKLFFREKQGSPS